MSIYVSKAVNVNAVSINVGPYHPSEDFGSLRGAASSNGHHNPYGRGHQFNATSSSASSAAGSSLDPENEISRNREFYRSQDVRPPFTYAALIRQVCLRLLIISNVLLMHAINRP